MYWAVLDKAKRNRKQSAFQLKRNKKHASVRAKVEHVFRIVKCQFGYRKTRYKGLVKNAAQVFFLKALANLYQARARCWRLQGNCAPKTPYWGKIRVRCETKPKSRHFCCYLWHFPPKS